MFSDPVYVQKGMYEHIPLLLRAVLTYLVKNAICIRHIPGHGVHMIQRIVGILEVQEYSFCKLA
jgi:hypothetical protein